jgi:hypothetical protein
MYSFIKANRKFIFSIMVAGSLAALSSCETDSGISPLVLPTTYDNTAFEQNAASQLSVLSAINDMTTEAKKGRQLGGKVSESLLKSSFSNGNPSVKSQTTTYFAGKLENEWFAEIAKASGTTYTPGNPATKGQGGMYGGYLFDENGTEIEQLIEKGAFGAAAYNHAVKLANGPLTPATADQLMAILGMNPTFPSSNASKHPKPDRAMAVYAARRDKNDGNGYYSQLKFNFIKLQAALNGGTNYTTDRDEALTAIFTTWEKVNAATVINYCHAVISTMSNTSTTDAQKASALHAHGENVAFLHGWRTISSKKITDAQTDELLALLNSAPNTTPTPYLFVTDSVNQLPKLQQIISKLQAIYGFSSAEIEDFKKNWITEQNR